MMTASDLIDICSLYFTQAAGKVREYRKPFFYWAEYDSFDNYIIRCSMYALSASLILEGVY